MKLNSVAIKQEINELVERSKAIVELCKTEVREMTEDEEKEFNSLKEQIDNKKTELKELEDKLSEYERMCPKEEEVKECEKEEKNQRNKSMKKSIVKELRNAIDNNIKTITVNAETRAMQVTGGGGVHDSVVETEIEGILEPLYANSVLSQLGNATNHIIEHNKQILLSEVASVKAENTSIKKLVVFCLLVTFISVILNIIMLL